jgi:hypothetical protein
VVTEPETIEGKLQKFKFLTQDSGKVYCRYSMRHKKSKKKFCADETGRQKKANFCAPCRPDTSTRKWPDRKTNFVFLAARADKACADATGHKKVAAWADTGEWTATGQAKRQFLRALQLMTACEQACADRSALTGQRPVQPVYNADSTGFDQDGPGKIWLKAAELKFSSEVRLASSSWTRKFSWPSQLSLEWILK